MSSPPKRMSWGDMSRPRPSTEAYRDGCDRIFGENGEGRRKKQDKLAAEATLNKALMSVKVYGEDASEESKKIVADHIKSKTKKKKPKKK